MRGHFELVLHDLASAKEGLSALLASEQLGEETEKHPVTSRCCMPSAQGAFTHRRAELIELTKTRDEHATERANSAEPLERKQEVMDSALLKAKIDCVSHPRRPTSPSWPLTSTSHVDGPYGLTASFSHGALSLVRRTL